MKEPSAYSSSLNRVSPYDLNGYATPDLRHLPEPLFPPTTRDLVPKSKSSNASYVRTTFYLPKTLHKKLKVLAAQKDRDMSGIIEELLDRWIKAEEAS